MFERRPGSGSIGNPDGGVEFCRPVFSHRVFSDGVFSRGI
jgi:hypothetical protein